MDLFWKWCMIFFICMNGLRKVKATVNILNEKSPEELIKYYIPTINAKNELCRNHSLFYLEELKQYKLWATEMFDATTKFPSGFLQGATNYNYGDFDECIDLNFSYRDNELKGKYCMVTVKITPPTGDGIYLKHNLSNYSMWNRINEYLSEPLRSPRNELGFGFCMPSSCTPADLQETLLGLAARFNQDADFKLDVKVDEIRCQVKESIYLNSGDIVFLLLMTLAIINVTAGSLYDYIIKREDYLHYKLKGRLHSVLLCFSVQRNFEKLTTVKNDAHGLDFTAGIKVLCMFFVIVFHRFMFGVGTAVINSNFIESLYSKIGYSNFLNGTILVDTFFTISGFLSSYLTLCQFHKAKKKLQNLSNVCSQICQMALGCRNRFIVNAILTAFALFRSIHSTLSREGLKTNTLRKKGKTTPKPVESWMISAYWIILLFYCTIFVKLGNGPLWRERIELEQQKCQKSWWVNLLFINNYYDLENYCMFQSWYMACDMNAFLLVPLLTLLLFKKPKTGIITAVLLIIASCVAAFVTVYVYDEHGILIVNLRTLLRINEDTTFVRTYIPGHIRVGPYFVGVLGGYLKYRMNLQRITLPTKWVWIGLVASVISLFLSLQIGFVFYNYKISTVYSALYASISRLAWSLGTMWIILAFSWGHLGYINQFLSCTPMVIISRLSYTVFLCHGIIQMFSVGTLRHPLYASVFNLFHYAIADAMLAYGLALVLTLLFELPIAEVEKLMWTGDKPEASPKKIEFIANIEKNHHTITIN